MRKSVELAFEQPQNTLPYVKQYAQEMNENVMLQHIKLYVNKYSIDLGDVGIKAINTLYTMAQENTGLPDIAIAVIAENAGEL